MIKLTSKLSVHTEARPYDQVRTYADGLPEDAHWRMLMDTQEVVRNMALFRAAQRRYAVPRINALKKAMAEGGHVNRDVNV
jgi:hypothetical protein